MCEKDVGTCIRERGVCERKECVCEEEMMSRVLLMMQVRGGRRMCV